LLLLRVPDRGRKDARDRNRDVRRFCGKGFICVGDALATAVKEYVNGKGRDDPNPFADYAVWLEQRIDVVEDMMDAFLEYPFAFARVVHVRRDEMIDIFTGWLWQHQPNAAIAKLRRMLKRERHYSQDDDYSVPIGSRYHPERAHILEQEDQQS
jgi:hypothetical protein